MKQLSSSIKKKLMSTSIFKKIEVVFHFQKNWGRLPFTLTGEVVFHLELTCCVTDQIWLILRRVAGWLSCDYTANLRWGWAWQNPTRCCSTQLCAVQQGRSGVSRGEQCTYSWASGQIVLVFPKIICTETSIYDINNLFSINHVDGGPRSWVFISK